VPSSLTPAAGSPSIQRVDEAAKARLRELFVRLCEIESPSGSEGAVARVVREEIEGIGLEVSEDGSAPETGADCGNLLTRLAGGDANRWVFMGAHLDTVPPADRVEVELADGYYLNSREAVLGADNKAAVAMLVELARILAQGGGPVGLELVFTTSEEIGLRGASAFDVAQLRSRYGYVFDHASPIGELVVAAPTYYQVEGRFRGRAAHAGLRPEEGRNAVVAAARAIGELELGRIDDETTANIGRIEGGTAANVVAERCSVVAETRSLDASKAGARAQAMVDTFSWAASEAEVDLDATVEQQFRAFRLEPGDEVVRVAGAGLRDCGFEPVLRSSGGGSDANAFNSAGLPCVNVANGTERNHTPDERVSAASLDAMLDVALRIVACAASA
jgi:tripeptide aminopeptidase